MKICTEILERNSYDQVSIIIRIPMYTLHYHFCVPAPSSQGAWFLKARALTEQTYVDEVEVEEEGIAEVLMDDTAIADVARGCGQTLCTHSLSVHGSCQCSNRPFAKELHYRWRDVRSHLVGLGPPC